MAKEKSGSIIIFGFGEEDWLNPQPSSNQISNQETKPGDVTDYMDTVESLPVDPDVLETHKKNYAPFSLEEEAAMVLLNFLPGYDLPD